MWKLFIRNYNFKTTFQSIHSRQCIWKKSLNTDSINKIPLKNIPVKSTPKNGTLENIFCPSWKVGIGFGSGILINALGQRWVVHCKQKPNVIHSVKRDYQDERQKFDWDKFWSYLWPHRLYFLAAIAAALAVAAVNIYIPQLIGCVVNILAALRTGSRSDFLEEIKIPAIKLVSLYIAQSFFTFLYIHLLAEIGEGVACQMKRDLYASILKQDIAFFDQERTGELINRITVDVQDFKSSFKLTISNGLRAFTQVIGSAGSLLVISPQLTGLTMLCIPSVVIGGSFIGGLLRKLSREAQEQIEKTTLVAEEALSNIRTVRAFAAEDYEERLFSKESVKAADLAQELGKGIGLFQAGTNLFLNSVVLGTLYLGGHLMSTGQLSGGDVMAFLINSQTIQRSSAQLSLLFGSVIKGLSAGGRVFEYINRETNMPVKGGKKIPYHEFIGDIEFTDVTFAYPTRPEATVLKNFNLKIPAGKTVAIVGTSGNGKSTIAALLERFYDVNDGKVTIDGHDVRNLDPNWLRGRALGYINQEPVLFATSIKENIRYGKPDASDFEVERAAKIANADNFVKDFPQGYNTLVGERGLALSGGQKQRIAIARALIKNPPILLLDEATSALDTESEQVVQHALEVAGVGRTVLVIAHRLSTVQNADVIVVLQGGKVVEMGNHDSLRKLRGHYWNLIKQQEQKQET
ncbi:mitochondrial potassium channel ATP-binding subunit [Arctopsyche grandis]|uniref:mitochondrial potassium channel ATP-binding subunit n=1 Tax=Arctopsyche grandis TaxID=121162 RepID=UPI00406D7DDD